jgi:hypothetical protein
MYGQEDTVSFVSTFQQSRKELGDNGDLSQFSHKTPVFILGSQPVIHEIILELPLTRLSCCGDFKPQFQPQTLLQPWTHSIPSARLTLHSTKLRTKFKIFREIFGTNVTSEAF